MERYWNFMTEVKGDIFYLDEYYENSYKWNRRIECFCAIASCSSIAAWTIWQNYSFLWGFIIAVMQVLTVIKQNLPFQKRLRIIAPFIIKLKNLYVELENDWYYIQSGKWNDFEANIALTKYKSMFNKIENSSMGEGDLLNKKRLLKSAKSKTEEYFKQFE